MIRKLAAGSAVAVCLAFSPAYAKSKVVSPLDQGMYFAPMGVFHQLHSEWNSDDSVGGSLAVGHRFGGWAIELGGSYAEYDAESVGSAAAPMSIQDPEVATVGGNVLIFPLNGFDSKWLRGIYAILGGGFTDIDSLTYVGNGGTPVSTDDGNSHYLQGGLGYLLPLSIGSYDFAIRAEAMARRTEEVDEPVPAGQVVHNDFNDGIYSLGLQLPMGLRPEPPPPPPAPVKVVKPVSICSDGKDNDGDGKTDYPADPGCTSADDNDETDPPQCSDGKDNDGDGLIDHPNDKGCESASDDDETDPCKTPAPGERVSLEGCGTGDIIVLRGVNFEFDRSRLTANAQSILDGVAEELNAYPDINIELSGHTDAKGSDSYNQSLSERRAASVRKYLVSKGIASSRMTSIGFGESQPVADNETEEGRALNRRTELKVTSGVARKGDGDGSYESEIEEELDAEEQF